MNLVPQDMSVNLANGGIKIEKATSVIKFQQPSMEKSSTGTPAARQLSKSEKVRESAENSDDNPHRSKAAILNGLFFEKHHVELSCTKVNIFGQKLSCRMVSVHSTIF